MNEYQVKVGECNFEPIEAEGFEIREGGELVFFNYTLIKEYNYPEYIISYSAGSWIKVYKIKGEKDGN